MSLKVKITLDLEKEKHREFFIKEGFLLYALLPDEDKTEPERDELFDITGFKTPKKTPKKTVLSPEQKLSRKNKRTENGRGGSVRSPFRLEFDEHFNEFLRLRHGEFVVNDVIEWFKNFNFAWDEGCYQRAKKTYLKNNFLSIANPEQTALSHRRFIKTIELKEREQKKADEEKEKEQKEEKEKIDKEFDEAMNEPPRKKQETLILELNPLPA